jgi:hypothetical protein
LKLIARVTFATLGAAGLSSTAVQSASGSLSSDVSSVLHQTATAAIAATGTASSTAWEKEASVSVDTDRVIDKIGEMAEQAKQHGIDIGDITVDESARDEELPRNPKKRMFEGEIAEPVLRDEL